MTTSAATSNIGAPPRGRYWCAAKTHSAARVTCPSPSHPIRQPSDRHHSLLSGPEPVLRRLLSETKTAAGRIQFP
jgi:hypothetical protein